jgi:hypothetical protein
METYTVSQFADRFTISELKNICRDNEFKGFSKYKRKMELCNFIVRSFSCRLQEIKHQNINIISEPSECNICLELTEVDNIETCFCSCSFCICKNCSSELRNNECPQCRRIVRPSIERSRKQRLRRMEEYDNMVRERAARRQRLNTALEEQRRIRNMNNGNNNNNNNTSDRPNNMQQTYNVTTIINDDDQTVIDLNPEELAEIVEFMEHIIGTVGIEVINNLYDEDEHLI